MSITKPELYRLTLNSEAAVRAFARLLARQKPPRMGVGTSRPDGKYDVGISRSLLDQLQTHALPKENLSDTLLRVDAAAEGTS
jgi:hypothetical protein